MLYRIQDFPLGSWAVLWRHHSNPIDEGYTTGCLHSYRHILSTSERGAVSKVAGGPPTGGPPVINFSLYANVQVEGKTKSKIRTIAMKGPVCGEPGSPYLLHQVHQPRSHRLREQLGQEQRRLGLKGAFSKETQSPTSWVLFLFGVFFIISSSSIHSRLQMRVHFFLRNMKTTFNS